MTVALFQKGKEFVWEGLELVMKVVDEAEVEAHTAIGWVLHPHETIDIPTEPEAAPVAPVPEQVQTPTEEPAAPAAPLNPFAPKV